MKGICIKSKTFDFGSKYGGGSFKAEKGKVYEYTKDNFGFNIQDENRKTLYYPIILNFHEFFTDLEEQYVNDNCVVFNNNSKTLKVYKTKKLF